MRTFLGVITTVMVISLFVAGYNAVVSSERSSHSEKIVQIIDNITPTQALRMKQENKEIVLLDIRTPEEYAGEHLAGAVNIDYYAAAFRTQLAALDKSTEYIVYCRTGNRSGRSLEIFRVLGFTKVHNVLGGIVRWQQESIPVAFSREPQE